VKVVILAGGRGARLEEETEVRPKPMVEIGGGMPILWHIMMHYHGYGFSDFVIALGYKGDYIKRWIADYARLASDLTVNTRTGEIVKRANGHLPEWTVDLVDTGLKTQTGGRVKRLRDHVPDETFLLTWGDGVSDIDLDALVRFHRSHGRIATVTAVRPPARFGHLEFDGDEVTSFTEKPQTAEGWINGAYFVLEPGVFDYIADDETHFEREPLQSLAADGELMAYKHESFWQCMDTLRDKRMLERLWETGAPPWKTWE